MIWKALFSFHYLTPLNTQRFTFSHKLHYIMVVTKTLTEKIIVGNVDECHSK